MNNRKSYSGPELKNKEHPTTGLKKCKKCGYTMAKTDKKCPSCGAKQRSSFNILLVVAVLLLLGACGSVLTSNDQTDEATSSSSSSSSNVSSSSVSSTSQEDVNTESVEPTEELDFTDALEEFNAGEYHYISPDDLGKLATKMEGEKVYSVFTVDSIEDDSIQFDKEDSMINQGFKPDKDYSKSIKEGDTVAMFGTVGEPWSLFSASGADVENAKVFAINKDAEQYIKDTTDEAFKKYIEEQEKEDAEKQEKESKSEKIEEPKYEVRNSEFSVYKPEYSDTYRYDALIEIENTGETGIYITGEQIDVEDNDGHLIQSDDWISSAPDVIEPGEKGYIYNQFGTELEGVADENNVNFTPHYKVKATDESPHEYPVSDISMKDDKTIVGRITNDTDEDISLIYINAFYYNSEGKCIGVNGVNVTDVTSGDTKSFEISSIGLPHGIADEIADYKVVARDMYIGI